MTLKYKLKKARGDHYISYNEIIKNSHVANKLWPESTPGSRRSLLSSAIRKDIDLRASQINILISIFPETTAQYWVQ